MKVHIHPHYAAYESYIRAIPSRNDAIRDGKPTEDVEDLILKVIDAPTKQEKRRSDREAR